jgi:hypothetical protein
LRSSSGGAPVRLRLGQLVQEGETKTFDLGFQQRRAVGTFDGQLIGSDAPQLVAQLEHCGGAEVRRTTAQRMRAIAKHGGVVGEGRGFELVDQLLGIGDEVQDQAAEKIILTIELT